MDEKKCVLSVRGLEKGFDGDHVLRGIDLDVYQGDVISVIGPAGPENLRSSVALISWRNRTRVP